MMFLIIIVYFCIIGLKKCAVCKLIYNFAAKNIWNILVDMQVFNLKLCCEVLIKQTIFAFVNTLGNIMYSMHVYV